ncbi:hypothetical protein EVG20_g3703 [Dentipellis fragilis]|uniref:PB1 domain-containing protein n=1 Tax=Dentipellis fragilis TaxID=205917 RepID=A0A4Y9Z1Z8_9AGAM|nr:hypothetical protein EVG20_g3703 [Dentipellis fragilis]
MSLKAELETWAAALKAYDEEDFEKSLDLFSSIADSSKILTNMGLIYATLGEHEAAVEQFNAATGLDQYLAVAYFQCGVSNFLLGRYDLSAKDFEEALLYLRGNQSINYTQLGLSFTLFSSEVLFNKGLSLIYMGQLPEGMVELEDAARQKATEEHNVIDEAIRDRGEGYTVFSIPVGVLYRPSENKLKNAKARDFLGKARLVASEDASEAYTTFTGVTRLKQGMGPTKTFVDRPDMDLASAAAANTGLSRSQTTPAQRPAPGLDVEPRTLQRANTTLNVPADARARIAARSSPTSPSGPGGGLARSASAVAPSANGAASARFPPPASARGMSRGPSMRNKAGASPGEGSPPRTAKKPDSSRMTEFYDSYIDSYTDPTPALPPLPGQADRLQPAPAPAPQPDRVAAWARNNSGAPPPSARAMSQYGGTVRSGTIRRRATRRTTMAPSMYDEDEEGYVTGSGEWDEVYELTKVRVKIHFEDEVRGMALDPTISYPEFLQRVADKFDAEPKDITLKFKDEDGGKVSLRDESDYELAIETARESAKGKPEGRLEVWCTHK